MENEEKESDNTALFACGRLVVDTWMDFAGVVVMEDGYVADIRYAAYKLEKTENYDVGKADCAFVKSGHDYDICYGEWEAVNVVRTNGTLYKPVYANPYD